MNTITAAVNVLHTDATDAEKVQAIGALFGKSYNGTEATRTVRMVNVLVQDGDQSDAAIESAISNLF